MNCTRCTAETHTEYLCHACAGWLRTVLNRIPDALTTARTTIARLDNVAAQSGRGSGGATSPINLEASKRADHLHALVGSWARLVLEYDDPAMRSVEPVAYLRMSVGAILRFEWAGDLTNELDDALKGVLRAVDIPPEIRTLGPCGTDQCPGVIRCPKDSKIARCRECGERYDVNAMQAWKISEAWEVSAPLAHIVKALNAAAHPIKQATARKWVERGKLKPNDSGMFTMADVYRVHADMQQKAKAS